MRGRVSIERRCGQDTRSYRALHGPVLQFASVLHRKQGLQARVRVCVGRKVRETINILDSVVFLF